jgi:hypothetical protein
LIRGRDVGARTLDEHRAATPICGEPAQFGLAEHFTSDRRTADEEARHAHIIERPTGERPRQSRQR